MLNGKAIELHEMGKGKRPMKADAINDAINEDEEDHLWNSGVLGNNDPVSLNHTMFFFYSAYILELEDVKNTTRS